MAIIEPHGLFRGERLANCSDNAQNWWPRLFIAANGHARIELSYQAIIGECFRSYRRPPSEDQLWEVFEEYASNFLAILYQADGIWWAEFDTSQKYLPKYKTRRDETSPSPSPDARAKHRAGYLEWKKAKSIQNQRFQKFSANSEKFGEISDGVGIGIGIGVGEVEGEVQKPLVELASECRRDRHSEIIDRVFAFYCQSLKRDPRRYALTKTRKAKAIARLKEREKICGSLELAERDLETAIQNLAASEYHTAGGYIDWEAQIFKSQDEFERRLNWKAPTVSPAKNGNGHNPQGARDAFLAGLSDEEINQ